ncbi:hypothetical protein ACFFWD_18375 [Bradyrhizobium erythrophlei]|uniref:hypothetical protein n=1 Tax=Bradyrhizobium erythrophlei TaxID=1437360 RepID=UPI0035EFC44B
MNQVNVGAWSIGGIAQQAVLGVTNQLRTLANQVLFGRLQWDEPHCTVEWVNGPQNSLAFPSSVSAPRLPEAFPGMPGLWVNFVNQNKAA